MTVYKVVSKRLELEQGARFITERQPPEAGALYLFQIGSLLILGRWFPGWIIQPGRWIDLYEIEVEVIGRVARI